MKLEECKSLKEGTRVTWSLGNGWYMTGKYIKLVEVTTFPPMTFSELLRGDISLDKGKKRMDAMVEYMEDGRTKTEYISPRKLHLV